jgi:hypothetical protein
MSWDQKPVITSGGRSFINPETPTGRYYALDPGFMAFQLARRARIVMLMVPV